MQSITYKEYKTEDDATKLDILKRINESVNNQLNNAFVHSYHINDDTTKVLQGLFEHRFVLQNTNGNLKDSSHPLLAILNEYSNHDASAQIQRYKNKGKITMTIGDSADGKLHANHNCLLLNSARDLYRASSTNTSVDLKNFSTGRQARTISCVNGSENCYFKADVAFSIHSLYDISVESVAQIFDNHDIDIMVAYIYFPLFIYDSSLVKYDLPGFGMEMIDKDRVMFSLKDYSAPYIHSYELWNKWATLSKISTPDFDINKETVRNIGPLHVVNFVRCRKSVDVMPLRVPITKYAGNLYKVPNIFHAADYDFAYRQFETPHYIAPASFCDPLMAYGHRTKDNSFQFSEFCAAAQGFRSSIIVGSKVYREKWEVDHNTYKTIVITLFVLCAAERAQRTGTISACFNELRELGGHDFFGRKWKTFTSWLDRTFYFNTFGKIDGKDRCIDVNAFGRWINTWQIVSYCDQIYQKSVHVELKNTLPHPPKRIDLSLDGDVECDDFVAKENKVDPSSNLDKETFSESLESIPIPTPPSSVKEEKQPLDVSIESSLFGSTDSILKTANLESASPIMFFDRDPAEMPRVFLAGHCAMNSVWHCLPRHSRLKQKEFLVASFDALTQYSSLTQVISEKEIRDYIFRGVWQSDASSVVIMLLAEIFKLNISVVSSKQNVDYRYGGESDKVHIINHVNNHYSNAAAMRGGAVEKFDSMIPLLLPYITEGANIIELSAAPGYLINKIYNACDEADIYPVFYAGVFDGVDNKYSKKYVASKFTQNTDGINIEKYKGDFQSIFKDKRFDCIISDAGRFVNTEALTSSAIKFCKKRLNAGGMVLIKSFGDPHDLYEYATHFRDYQFVAGKGTERYFIGRGFNTDANLKTTNIPFRTFDEVYDAHHRDYTEHVLYADYNSIVHFNKTFFSDGFAKYSQNVKKVPEFVNLICFTGFASSSKTTKFAEDHPDAIFISPTKQLSISHQNLGVKSYTQHVIFGVNLPDDAEIVVDEISQFCVEYIYMLKLRFPNAVIYALGDIHQTEFSNYKNNIKFTTFESQGIRNNKIDVYKIPQDITACLNKSLIGKFELIRKSLSHFTELALVWILVN